MFISELFSDKDRTDKGWKEYAKAGAVAAGIAGLLGTAAINDRKHPSKYKEPTTQSQGVRPLNFSNNPFDNNVVPDINDPSHNPLNLNKIDIEQESKSQVPSNPKQKQGPAGQARGTDKAPFRNKLVGEATGLKKRVKIVKGPAAGRTGYVGEVHHGQFKGAPKHFVIDLDGGGNIMCSKDQLRLIKDDMGEALERTPQQADPDFSKPMFGEGDNPQDEITVDVPLLIRLLEYAREDAKTDMDLHNVAEQLIKLSGQGCLSMKQYNQIVGSMKEMAPGRQAYAGRGNVPGMASA